MRELDFENERVTSNLVVLMGNEVKCTQIIISFENTSLSHCHV